MEFQAFIQALLPTAVFLQIFSFFTVCLVNYLREVLLWLAPKLNFFEIQVSRLLENAFPALFLTAETQLVHCLQWQQFFLKFQSFMESFMRQSFITQFKIEFLLPITSGRKVLGEMAEFSGDVLLFQTRSTHFRQFWSHNLELFKVKFGNQNNLNMKN